MISDVLLSKCRTDSERETALFFDSIGLTCVDLSFKIKNKDNDKLDLGEIDGIFLDTENEVIIIYDDCKKKEKDNAKITTFFTKCKSSDFIDQIYAIKDVPQYKIYILYIDKLRKNNNENDIAFKHIDKDNTYILFKEDFEYFQLLVEGIGAWAKNDLYNLINIKPNQMRVGITATQVYIGNTPAYIFVDRSDRILRYSYISRRRDNDHGYQRMVDFKRIKIIKEALESGNLIGFPTSILLNSTDKINTNPYPKSDCPKIIELTIPNNYSGCRVVDGQHRLLSFSKLSLSEQSKHYLPIVLMDNLDNESEIKLFLDINDNAKSVDPSLRYDLIAQSEWSKTSENYLVKIAVNIVKEIEKSSPFKDKSIFKGNIGDNKKSHITLKSFVDSIKKNKLVDFEGGLLQSQGNIDDILNPSKYIREFLIFINKEAKDKEYFYSNRGIELICSLISHIVSIHQGVDIPKLIKEYANIFIRIVNQNIDELRKYQGEKGFKDAFELIINKTQQEVPSIFNITNCKKDHKFTDNIVKKLSIDQSLPGRHKCASCAYERGYEDGKQNLPKLSIEILSKELSFSQAKQRRHRSVSEAYELGYQNGLLELNLEE